MSFCDNLTSNVLGVFFVESFKAHFVVLNETVTGTC